MRTGHDYAAVGRAGSVTGGHTGGEVCLGLVPQLASPLDDLNQTFRHHLMIEGNIGAPLANKVVEDDAVREDNE
jgi:hypothetical protein